MGILVTGATGGVGRHVVSELRDEGAGVRALIHRPGPATALPDGVEWGRGDLADPGSLVPALDGIDTVFLLLPALAPEGEMAASTRSHAAPSASCTCRPRPPPRARSRRGP